MKAMKAMRAMKARGAAMTKGALAEALATQMDLKKSVCGKGEDARRLHFTSSDLSKRSDHLPAHRLFAVHLSSERFGKCALCHSCATGLHRPHCLHRLHRLHGRHAGYGSVRRGIGEGCTEAM